MATNVLGLREQAVFEASSPSFATLVRSALLRVEPSEFGWVGVDQSAPFLVKLIGQLNDKQWTRVERGDVLSLDEFTTSQRDLIRQFVMSYRGVLESPDHPEGAQGRPLSVDATEAYPNGLPEGFALQLAVEPETAVFAVPKGGTPLAGAYAPWQAARALFFKQNPGYEQHRFPGELPRPEGFTVAKNRKLTFRFQMEPAVVLTQSLRDTVAPERKVVSYEELPEDYRERVVKAYKAVERGYLGGNW